MSCILPHAVFKSHPLIRCLLTPDTVIPQHTQLIQPVALLLADDAQKTAHHHVVLIFVRITQKLFQRSVLRITDLIVGIINPADPLCCLAQNDAAFLRFSPIIMLRALQFLQNIVIHRLKLVRLQPALSYKLKIHLPLPLLCSVFYRFQDLLTDGIHVLAVRVHADIRHRFVARPALLHEFPDIFHIHIPV